MRLSAYTLCLLAETGWLYPAAIAARVARGECEAHYCHLGFGLYTVCAVTGQVQ